MEAFEKWSKDYFNEHGFAPTPNESFRAGMRAAAGRIPSNWCDPLLTGQAGIGEPPWDCPAIERLLEGLRTDILAEADK